MGNVMLLSVGLWSTTAETMGGATRELMHWISAFIALPTILFSGRPFFRSAFKALKNRRTNMDMPISLAILLAGGMSLFETIHHGEHVYFDSAVMLLFFLLIGRYLDFRARKTARSTATDLLNSLNGFANIVENGETKHVLIRDLKEDHIVHVSVGEKIPADGIVTYGQSDVDTSLITGESAPRSVTQDEEVFAGTINMSAPIMMRVCKPTENSILAEIVRLMDVANQSQAAYVRIADRAAQLYTPVVHILAIVAFLGWWLFGDLAWQPSLMIAITVLIITCPCALGLAVPVVQVLASSRLFKKGILVKSGDALERLARIDTVFLDKTGTLTRGHAMLYGDYKSQDLKRAASLAAYSSHPLSRAMTQAFDGSLLQIRDIIEHAGLGIEGNINGKHIRLGRRSWCGDETAAPIGSLEIWLSYNGKPPVQFCFRDTLRIDARETVENFQHRNITPIILSGDRIEPVSLIADACGIEDYHAALKPTEKYKILEEHKRDGHNVLMVGDGLNDAPVLAAANISIAPGSAIDLAQNAADIVFMSDSLSSVYECYQTACKTQILIGQNFILAIVYNIIAVPLALSGMVTPFIAAIAMSGSSLIVIANSFRLKWMS